MPGELKTEWYSGGQTREVVTVRNEGESVADWKARHRTEVAEAMQTYPPE